MDMHSPVISVAPERVAELERLGDQIAELSAPWRPPARASWT